MRVPSTFSKKAQEIKLIDCMVLNAVFNSISVISRLPVHLCMLSCSSFNQYSANILSKPLAAFTHNHCQNNDSGESGMNPVAISIINPWKEY